MSAPWGGQRADRLASAPAVTQEQEESACSRGELGVQE